MMQDDEVSGGPSRGRGPARGSVTARDVAGRADVSLSTVSRAIRGSGYVAPAVKERILEAASDLGYVPSATARNLKLRSGNVIGVIVSDLRNSFYADVAHGAGLAARQANHTMMLADDQGVMATELEVARSMVAWNVAGVVVAPLGPQVTDFLLRQGVQVVEIDRQFAAPRCDGVVVANREGARRMTARLLEAGHRRIGVILDETDWTTGRERLAGHQEALRAFGVPFEPSLVRSSGWAAAEAEQVTLSFLTEEQPPSAVFAVNNVVAEGVWRAARRLGRCIPQQLSLVAFDDTPWMSMVDPGITVVTQDATAIGATAVDRLLARVRDPGEPPRTVVLPVDVLERGSVAGTRGAHM